MAAPFDATSLTDDLKDAHSRIRSVLLIDSPDITRPVAQFLRQKGWFVEEATNAGQARNLVQRFNADFVLIPCSHTATITVNKRPVKAQTLLSPGDSISLGVVQLQLHGINDAHMQPTLDIVMRELKSKRMPPDDATLSKAVAIILQCHWQNQRTQTIQQRRAAVDEISATSSESSVVQQLSESGLHEV